MPQETGLEPKKARPCSSCLYWKTTKMKRSEEISRGCDKVAQIRAEVDKFSKKVKPLILLLLYITNNYHELYILWLMLRVTL